VSDALDPAPFLDSLDAALGGTGACREPRLNARGFFAQLDRHANPFLLGGLVARGQLHGDDADQRRAAVKQVTNELRTRLELRCRGLDESRSVCPSLEDRVFAHLVPRCRTISRLFLDLVDEYFGRSVRLFERAFTWFATGELRLELPGRIVTTQPSSGTFFLFGEFALMAHDYGIEPDRWWRLANVMVRSQRVFARVYAPASLAHATLASYSARDFARHGGALSRRELLELERLYERADLALECARNCAAAMPGILR
jgi:hypothetical protein